MKEISDNQLGDYLKVGLQAYDGSYEFKWLKEYKRCKYFLWILSF